jgi:hypothetical protein
VILETQLVLQVQKVQERLQVRVNHLVLGIQWLQLFLEVLPVVAEDLVREVLEILLVLDLQFVP